MPTLKSWALNTMKLRRPGVTADLVTRPRLVAQLDRGLAGFLTLVCASAGYGKTTLVSAWLDSQAASPTQSTCALPAAWLSLDEYDGDLAAFVYYFCAALGTIFPEACPQTRELLWAPQEAPLNTLSATLSSEIASLPTEFILVLDDYHAIKGVTVHDLLAALTRHWPRTLHLVLIARSNPPLPLATLRSKGHLTEIRTRDLRFTTEEMAQYLTGVLGRPPGGAVLAQLAQQTEGWVTGLRLAAMSLPKDLMAARLPALAEADTNIGDYLIEELLAHQPPDILKFLLQTSLLDRFCAPLCDKVLERSAADRDARACLDWLERTNFLMVALDDRGEWYRYHHLLQDLLRRRAAVELGAERGIDLRRRAAAWFGRQGLLEEALQQALAAHDLEQAAGLMEQALRDVLNREDLPALRRWLRLLPQELRSRRPELLLIEAWMLSFSWRLGELSQVLEQLETLVGGDAGALAAGDVRILRGQILTLRGEDGHFRNQADRGLACVQEALPLLPESWTYVRGGCMLYLGLSSQALGQGGAVDRQLWTHYEAASDKSGPYALRILLALCMNAVQAGKLEQARQTGGLMLAQARRGKRVLLAGWAHLWLGVVHYEWDELEAATEHFQAIAQRRFSLHSVAARQGMLGLLLVQFARGDVAGARETLKLASQYDIDILGYESAETLSARAQLQFLNGEVVDAWRWADAFTAPVPDQPLYWLQNAHMVRARLLIARGAAPDVQAALQIIDALVEIAERTHNIYASIRVLALRALALDARRQDRSPDAVAAPAALAALGRALALAQPGGFVRSFVDLGPRMETLLNRRTEHGPAAEVLWRIRAAFPAPHPSAGQPSLAPPALPLPEPLTARELDILRLLRDRLSDKEIANKLVVVPGTVRSHLANLYGKLSVNKRRDAVAKAEALGILPPR